MTSSSSSATVAQLVKPEYRNWLALGHALTTELCQGLRPFINRMMETFYKNLTARLAATASCTCVYVPGRRPNQYHDMSTCVWANFLEAHHLANKPNWKQSDSTKWLDSTIGPWEIAKLFLPDLGGHVGMKSAEDMDITGILNLMYWCTHFTIPQPLIKDVRDTRNKWVHLPSLELTDADKKTAFDAIENLLKDPSLAHEPAVLKALKDISNLKSVSDLHSMEARVLADFREVIRKEILIINTELTNLVEESARNKEQQTELKQEQEMMKKSLEDLNHTKNADNNFVGEVFLLFGSVLGSLSGNVKGVKKGNVVTWLILLLLLHFYVVLDDPALNKDGERKKIHVLFMVKAFSEYKGGVRGSGEVLYGKVKTLKYKVAE